MTSALLEVRGDRRGCERLVAPGATLDGRMAVMGKQLAVLGAAPRFVEPLHVGRPNVGDPVRLRERIDSILDRRWFTNHGPMVQEFEAALQAELGVSHVIAVCNATLGLEIATRAMGMSGEVIVPAFTFVATAHAIQWQGLSPVFADVDLESHTLDPESVRELITPRTTGILGVHTWGTGCATAALEAIASEHGLVVMYDAAHALGSTHNGASFGGNGSAEVFSFHATKYVNSFEGGAISTNDPELAARIRSMVNFGFEGYDLVTSVGTNAKMSEMSAAMGLTSLESMHEFRDQNSIVRDAYQSGFEDVDGLELHRFRATETNSLQYVVVEVAESCPLSRDQLVEVLHAENCLARRYFYPGVHRMEPYRSLAPMAYRWLPNTEALAQSVMILPTGTAIEVEVAAEVCSVLRLAVELHTEVESALRR